MSEGKVDTPSPCPHLNCLNRTLHFEPNPDIAGNGVVIGFVGTAYLVFVLLLAHYFVAYDPKCPPPKQVGARSEGRPGPRLGSEDRVVQEHFPVSRLGPEASDRWKPNLIDVRLLEWIRHRTLKAIAFCGLPRPAIGHDRSRMMQKWFDKCIASMCDVQMVAGFTILFSGFICLDETLTALHWQFIVNFAWFSCVTHLSGLTVLRRYLQHHSVEKHVRVSFMLLLLVVLMVAMVPTAFFNWIRARDYVELQSAAIPRSPAICFFQTRCAIHLFHDSCDDKLKCVSFWQTPALQELVVSLIILLAGFLSRTVKLSARASAWLQTAVRNPVDSFIWALFAKLERKFPCATDRSPSGPATRSLWPELITRPAWAIIVLFETQMTLFNSMLGELCWLLIILLWGTWKLYFAFIDDHYYSGSTSANTRWQFGQVLPVLLLAAPLANMLGVFTSGEAVASKDQEEEVLCPGEDGHEPLPCRKPQPADANEESPAENAVFSQESSRATDGRQRTKACSTATDASDMQRAVSTFMSKDLYSEASWMLPYLSYSVAVVWVHVSVLLPFSLLQLAFATDAGYETTLYSLSGWNVSILDYFFQEGNIYFILFNYPFVGFATILAGSAAESWWKRPVTTKGRVLRNIYFWLLCFALHGGYLTIMYFPNVLWAKFVWTGGATVCIVALYIFASFMNLRRRERRRGTRSSDVD